MRKRKIAIVAAGVVLVLVGCSIAIASLHKSQSAKQAQKAQMQARAKRTQANTLPKVDQKSLACDTVSAKAAGALLKADLERQANFLSDRPAPNAFSTCSYRAKGKGVGIGRSVTIIIRQSPTVASAQQTVASLRKVGKGEDVKGIGDEAYYLATANQFMARKGNKTALIIMSKPSAGEPASLGASQAIAKIALK